MLVIGTEVKKPADSEGSRGAQDPMLPPENRDLHPSLYGELTRGRLLVVVLEREEEGSWVPRLAEHKTFPRPVDSLSTVRWAERRNRKASVMHLHWLLRLP